jgi:hypothetical protein
VTITYSMLGRRGRLGNQCFEIAGALAVSRRLGEDLSLPDWSYAPYFSVPPEVFAGAHGKEAHDFVPHLGTAAAYLQDYALVAEVEKTIRRWFAPSLRSIHSLHETPAAHRTSIHVRRTDYLLSPRHYVALDAAWYAKAMNVVRARHPDTVFEVFSDDPEWCRKHFPDCKVVSTPPPAGHTDRRDADGHALPNPTELCDFWRQVSADAHIVANSAFSWWAAFLSGDPSPIVPAKWYGPAYADLDESRLIPPHWTAL